MKYFSMKSMFRTLAMTSSMMLALPAFAQIDGEQVDSNPHAEFLSESGFAMENCDALAEPAQLKEVIDLATSKMSNNIIVCVLPGDSKQTLNLKYPGLRVIALQPGLTNLDVVYINSPTVLFGFNIGHLAIDKLAAGSVVAASSLSKAASLTTDVIFIGNKLIKGIDGPTGRISVAMHLPNYARGLNLARNNTPLSATQTGDNTVAGWLPRSVLSSSADTGNKERKNSNQFGQVNNAKDSKVNQPNPGNIQDSINWFAQTKLVAHTSPNREGEKLKRALDVPVYRNPNTADKPITGMVFVPMVAGKRPDLTRLGVIFGLH